MARHKGAQSHGSSAALLVRNVGRIRLLDWREFILRQCLIGLTLPFHNFILMHPAERQKLFHVKNHFFPAQAIQRIIIFEKDGFFGAYLLAESAEDAAEHVNFKLSRPFLNIANIWKWLRPRGRYSDGFWRANKLTKLAGDTFCPAVLVAHEVWGAAIAFAHLPFELWMIAARGLGCGMAMVEKRLRKMPPCDLDAAPQGRQIKPLPPRHLFAFNNHFYRAENFMVSQRAAAHSHAAVTIILARATGVIRFHPKLIN